ncbi:hypothetical protein GCM10029964_096980 [Kibdelosporangium lantanae]
MVLFRDLFGTAEMRAVFCDRSYVDHVVRVEVALARAEARVGVIPRHSVGIAAERTDAQDRDSA